MENNKQKQNNNTQNTNGNAVFFRLTKEQLSVNVDKYDKALRPSASLFNLQNYNAEKLRERPVIFQKRINSTDSAILEENAYIALDNQELKLEKKIENYEQIIKNIDEKIFVADAIKDQKALDELNEQKKVLSQKLLNLQAQYKTQNFDTGLTVFVAKILKYPKEFKKMLATKIKYFIRHSKYLRKYSPIVKLLEVKETLGKLDKINKSVDELVKMKVPFGEQEERYNTLVNHLSQAGALHSQILKELKD